jgi:molecular chaperone GrpE (heat shock protein)
MNDSMTELENIITLNLQSANNLKNEVEKKENEKYDQLKDISLGMIDILDSFERVEESLIEKSMDKNEEASKTMKRYKTIHKKLLNLLQKYGITKIEFPDNRLIVGLCEVVETEADINRKNDEIISIVRSGYIRGKELIRAAQIIVVKN